MRPPLIANTNNGYEVEVGDYVAFNRSGNVVLGVVKAVNLKWREFSYPKGQFYFCGSVTIEGSDKITSKVRNLGSIATITKHRDRMDAQE